MDTSRSSIDKTRSTKRNALREFYKLQPADPDASLIASSVISSARTSISDINSVLSTNAGEDDWEAEEQRLEAKLDAGSFDAGSFDAQEIARDILAGRGSGSRVLKDLLKKENTLLQSIRVLQSEQKALVYNNYSRLIAVSETLAKMKKGSHADSQTGDIQIRIGDEVREDTKSIEVAKKKLPGLVQQISTASRNLQLDATGEKLGPRQVAQWLLNTPAEVEKMEGEARSARIEESLSVLNTWMAKGKVKGLDELKISIEALR